VFFSSSDDNTKLLKIENASEMSGYLINKLDNKLNLLELQINQKFNLNRINTISIA